MEIKLTKFAQIAALGLALALIFSCSSDDGGGGGEKIPSSSSVNSPVDCTGFVEGTQREHYGKSKPQFCDARDGKRYVYVQMGAKTWMAENLNYTTSGSECYGNQEINCNTYGRLYKWASAKTACPRNWHLPDYAEWNALMKFINPICYDYKETFVCSDAGTKLKATSSWRIINGIPRGTDDYGWTALASGYDNLYEGEYLTAGLGEMGVWWNASDYGDPTKADASAIFNNSEDFFFDYLDKSGFFSVRCVKD